MDPDLSHAQPRRHPELLPASIRRATADDAAGACDVVCRSITQCCAADHGGNAALISRWLANKTVANLRTWISAEGATALVAQRGGAIVGFALLAGDELVLCYVVPEALHQGVGKALLNEACAGARAQGLAALRLDSTRTALPFYQRAGGVAAGPVRHWAGLEAQPLCLPLEPAGPESPPTRSRGHLR